MNETPLEIANVVIQGVIGLATVITLVSALLSLRLNKAQYGEDKKRHRESERRSQAEKVAAWIEDGRVKAISSPCRNAVYRDTLIINESCLPIYDVVITVVGRYGAGPNPRSEDNAGNYEYRALFLNVPNGLWGQKAPTGGEGMHTKVAVEIAFSDAKGNHWVRRGNGTLEELPCSPLEHYHIPMPCEWSSLIRVAH